MNGGEEDAPTTRYVYWQEDDTWLGYLEEFPDYLTQGVDLEDLREHYALTLRHWLDRFESASGSVREQFGERFVRMWRLYLAGSLAAFVSGSLQLFQIVFSRETNNDIPWDRAALYDRPS